MFDKLDDLILRYEEVMNLLSEPDVANDTNRFRDLMKEQANHQLLRRIKNIKHAKKPWKILWRCWKKNPMKICVIC